jgi:antitoxin (DNA-binding transcriptional repressor) of toxin-antitoxin stability system
MKARRPRQFAEEAPPFRGGGAGLREIPASEAKAHLSELLDAVERGETIVIARLVPDGAYRKQVIAQALENIKKLGEEVRRQHGPTSVEEILSSIHEGHKY